MWYDIQEDINRGCLFNFITGARGVGKTYSATRYSIDLFLQTKRRLIYIRRYSKEMRKVKNFYSAMIRDNLYPGYEFKSAHGELKINDECAGYCEVLARSLVDKGSIFENPGIIIFDEFLIPKSSYHYLPNEVELFLDLYETVTRMDDVPVVFLSNATSINNPYFNYFNIKMPGKGSQIYRRGEVLWHKIKADEYAAVKKQTRFGKLIAGTRYADYAFDNEFLDDDDNFIANKTAQSEFTMSLVINGIELGVWTDYKNGLIFISNDIDPSLRVSYALSSKDHGPNRMLFGHKKPILINRVIEAFNNGYLYFENTKVKAIAMNAIRQIL